jgi:hypothetical protein
MLHYHFFPCAAAAATYFLQEYFGFTPNCWTAFERGVPALKSFFFPLKLKTVICKDDELAAVGSDGFVTKPETTAWSSITVASRTMPANRREIVFIMN